MAWTQAVCHPDWNARHPDREPVRMKAEFADEEVCCDCGEITRDGIYIRVDPATVKFPKLKD